MSCAPHLHTFKKTPSLVFFIQQIAREVLFWFLMFLFQGGVGREFVHITVFSVWIY